jgi:NAD(P)-dependent dehydrogenase (short-subunit alcohol dehydrogenase family)
MPGEFQGKVVVVTGGSRGIGREIAREFAAEGAETVIASSSEANLASAAKIIAQAGAAPLTVVGNL